MMKKRNFKKGLSPVIATVLLVMLVLVLVALIFLWMSGLITEQIQKNNQAVETICPSVSFDANIIVNSSGKYLEIVNRGSVSINSLSIKSISATGESKVIPAPISVDVGKALVAKIDNYIEGEPEQVIVYPVLLGVIKGGDKTKTYTCNDLGKTISI